MLNFFDNETQRAVLQPALCVVFMNGILYEKHAKSLGGIIVMLITLKYRELIEWWYLMSMRIVW